MFRPEDYVTHDVAITLEEKGFREPCAQSFLIDKDGYVSVKVYGRMVPYEQIKYSECGIFKEYLRPTLYQAQKYLREKHKIFLTIDLVPPHLFGYACLDRVLYRYNIYQGGIGTPNFSFEDALNDGIREACKLIQLWDKD